MAPKRKRIVCNTIHLWLATICLPSLCNGFTPPPIANHPIRLHPPTMSNNYHLQQSKNNDPETTEKDTKSTQDKKSNSYSWEELQADPELSQLERQSSLRRKNAMLLPQRISQATGIVAWTFVIVGIVLNTLGYAYVRDPSGGIGIGTLKWEYRMVLLVVFSSYQLTPFLVMMMYF